MPDNSSKSVGLYSPKKPHSTRRKSMDSIERDQKIMVPIMHTFEQCCNYNYEEDVSTYLIRYLIRYQKYRYITVHIIIKITHINVVKLGILHLQCTYLHVGRYLHVLQCSPNSRKIILKKFT